MSAARRFTVESSYALWLSTLSASTRSGYAYDLGDLAAFLELPGPVEAIRHVIRVGPSQAFGLVHAWRQQCVTRGLSLTTRNRRLSTLRSCLKFLSATGCISWQITIAGERHRYTIQDKVLPLHKVAEMLELACPRDRAMLWLLYGAALRRNEVLSLDWPESVDLARGVVWIQAKGWKDRQDMDVPPQTTEAIRAWLQERGDWPGALFCRIAPNGGRVTAPHARICGEQLFRIVRDLAQAVGLQGVGPHHLRHTAGTQAAKTFNGDMRLVQQFLRHSSLITTSVYVHAAKEERAKTAAGIADALAAAQYQRQHGKIIRLHTYTG